MNTTNQKSEGAASAERILATKVEHHVPIGLVHLRSVEIERMWAYAEHFAAKNAEQLMAEIKKLREDRAQLIHVARDAAQNCESDSRDFAIQTLASIGEVL